MLSDAERGVEAVGSSGFDTDNLRLLAQPRVSLDALHETVEETTATNAADNGVHGDFHLLSQLGDQSGGTVPDIGVVKRRDEDTSRVLGDKFFLDVLGGSEKVLANLLDLSTELDKLVLHESRGGDGNDDCARAVQRKGRSGGSETSVASGCAVEVNIARSGGSSTGHHVSNTSRLERTTGLKVIELEVDVAENTLVIVC